MTIRKITKAKLQQSRSKLERMMSEAVEQVLDVEGRHTAIRGNYYFRSSLDSILQSAIAKTLGTRGNYNSDSFSAGKYGKVIAVYFEERIAAMVPGLIAEHLPHLENLVRQRVRSSIDSVVNERAKKVAEQIVSHFDERKIMDEMLDTMLAEDTE